MNISNKLKEKIAKGICSSIMGAPYFLCGVLIGSILGNHFYKPSSVYLQDLNNDNRPDIIVHQKNPSDRTYIQQKDGTYKPLKEIYKQMKKENKKDIKEMKKSIEEKLVEM